MGLKQIAIVLLLLLAVATNGPNAGAQASEIRQIHIAGEDARNLISLLASASKPIASGIKDKGLTNVRVYDLRVWSTSTEQYGSESPYHDLSVFAATARLDQATKSVEIGEATSLFRYFRSIGIEPELGLEGASFMIRSVDCKIAVKDLTEGISRFSCALSYHDSIPRAH